MLSWGFAVGLSSARRSSSGAGQRDSHLSTLPAVEEEPQEGPQILINEAQLAGVWANWAQVSHSIHEFTLDFVRMDFTGGTPGRGVVVARVSVSPLFVTQLIEALEENWKKYAEKALPQEGQSAEE